MTTTNFCTHCGTGVQAQQAFCTDCGVAITPPAVISAAAASAASNRTPPFPAAAPLPSVSSTPHVLPHSVPASAQTGSAGGKLLASGVLSIITGSVYLLMALTTVSMKDTVLGDMVDDATGILTLMLLIFLGLGGGFIAVGAGACRVKQWARAATLALGGLSLLFFLIVLMNTGEASMVVPIAWFGLIVGLAVNLKPQVAPTQPVQQG